MRRYRKLMFVRYTHATLIYGPKGYNIENGGKDFTYFEIIIGVAI